MDENTGLFSNVFMFVIMMAGMATLIWMLRTTKRQFPWTTAVWLLPMFWMAVFYGILVFQIEPIHSDPTLRVALYRPGFFFFFLFVILDKLNGRVNLFLDSILQGVSCFWASMHRKS